MSEIEEIRKRHLIIDGGYETLRGINVEYAHKDRGRLLGEIDFLRVEIDKKNKALRQSMTALDDWLNIHCQHELKEHSLKRVEEAWGRIKEYGTLYYIAMVQKNNREALSREVSENE